MSQAVQNRRLLAAVLAGIACIGALSGCADAGTAPEVPLGQDTSPNVGTAPHFDGPWSDWFTRIYESSDTTEPQRAILADGVVTDAEYAGLRAAFKTCLEDLGVSVELYADGGYAVEADGELTESQVTGDAVPGCEKKTVGAVAMLYEHIRRNPEERDEAVIVVDCFKRKGIVSDAYTVAQYNKDVADQTGLNWSAIEVRRCAQDPLGVLDAP